MDTTGRLPGPVIRPYRDEDHDEVYDICVRTAAAGDDARPGDTAGPDVHVGARLAGPASAVAGER
ncbi:hypothetical protein [Micromonospora sp. LOL_024]|uniref:hypothetical protein n=1 Tax=Micromonospora sp. LOL_024 TaxID=3345412 RepID=UPI003A8A5183